MRAKRKYRFTEATQTHDLAIQEGSLQHEITIYKFYHISITDVPILNLCISQHHIHAFFLHHDMGKYAVVKILRYDTLIEAESFGVGFVFSNGW